ncbi:MAG: hypothetical protein UX13_C0006G0012 [Candidatus Woesebacteria bacterium GW2011_GWB1_45_5]|uniref:Uncharacterized protein n=1 Tax=Candidatus Woesebacteria bacterium GW2011_GWB1_45_5 TaxID=1618581 RepID=A0A0G1MQP1_9BACT|nr:MAG: hypothetical protein UX13_C0006G0012 [Candidatus Woesebacteria bacterium GW2011_GWB1_45_5]
MDKRLLFYGSLMAIAIVLMAVSANLLIASQFRPTDPVSQCIAAGKYYNASTGYCEEAGAVCEVFTKFIPVHDCPTGLTCRTSPFILWGVCQP